MAQPVIIEDTRQQAGKHGVKHRWLADRGVALMRAALPVGDYMAATSAWVPGLGHPAGGPVSVDTKRDLDELLQNVSGKGHRRFRDECIRARDMGVQLVVLTESTAPLARHVSPACRGCTRRLRRSCDPHDLRGRCARHGTRKPAQGAQAAKAIRTMAERYGVVFEFCQPEDSARRICELLGVGVIGDGE